MAKHYDYEEIASRLWWGLAVEDGIAGKVTAYYCAYLGCITRGDAMLSGRPFEKLGSDIIEEAKAAGVHLFTVAHKVIGVYANSIIDFADSKVIPRTYRPHAWPSIAELEQKKENDNQIGGIMTHPVTVVFSDGSSLSVSYKDGIDNLESPSPHRLEASMSNLRLRVNGLVA